MIIKAIKTRLVHAGEISLEDLLKESLLPKLPEKSVIVISSKIVALCENRVVPFDQARRDELIAREAEYFIDPDFSPYGHHFTINDGTLVGSAGIDLSNADNNWVLWPRDSFLSASKIQKFLREYFKIKDLGVLIIDSVSSPLRRGTKGEMIAWSGFEVVKDYVGGKDLFGREFEMEMSGIGTSLAVAANVVMGEGIEQTPLALITDIDFVKFVEHNPTRKEIDIAFVPFDDDLFMPFLKLIPWKKGRGRKTIDEK
jgi:F420-0:gamma-glutamyl ligase